MDRGSDGLELALFDSPGIDSLPEQAEVGDLMTLAVPALQPQTA